jgi:hypothetical protein
MKSALLSFIKTGQPGWDKVTDNRLANFSPEISVQDTALLEARLGVLSKTVERIVP